MPFAVARKSFFNLFPHGVGSLFLIQLFSTLSFCAIYSSLELYATNWLRLSDTLATSITASFIALNFVLHLFAGIAGGRVLSYRSLFAIGMLCEFLGCILIATPTSTSLFWGLAAFLTGAGFNTTCINCMITQRYQPNDKRRETAFLINYSCLNVGAFIGYFMGGYFHLRNEYHALFLFCSIGNLIAFLLAAIQWKYLQDIHTTLSDLPMVHRFKYNLLGISIIVACIFGLRWLLDYTQLANQIILFIGMIMAIVMIYLTYKQSQTRTRNKMLTYLILSLAALIFFTLYQLAPMGMALFIERNVERHFFGMLIPPQWAQNLNPLIVIIGAPLLSMAFIKLRRHGIQVSIPLQFSIALILIGLAYTLLPLGIHFADPQGYVNFGWIMGCYLLQSLGELFLVPIGYAMIGQYAPTQLQGVMMGTWMMINGVAAIISSHFSTLALNSSPSTSPLATNLGFNPIFLSLGCIALASGILLLISSRRLTLLTEQRRAPA